MFPVTFSFFLFQNVSPWPRVIGLKKNIIKLLILRLLFVSSLEPSSPSCRIFSWSFSALPFPFSSERIKLCSPLLLETYMRERTLPLLLLLKTLLRCFPILSRCTNSMTLFLLESVGLTFKLHLESMNGNR